MSTVKINFGGDFYISEDFQNQDIISPEVIELFQKADYSIVNLEAPICINEQKNKIIKTGPHLRTTSDAVIPALQSLSIDLVTMANNHIMDYGGYGLAETLEVLKASNIDYVGAGMNLREASMIYTIEKNGISIGILNFAENEWSIADEFKPGANPLDIIDNVNQIKKAKNTHDKVICIIHGGVEFFNYPSPRMIKQYRFYVANGADAIVCHHPHVISGYEIYEQAPIIYSIGNFIFTKSMNIPGWYTGTVIEMIVSKSEPVTIGIHPVQFDNKLLKLVLLKNSNKKDIIKKIEGFSKIIKDKRRLNEKWSEYAFSKVEQYTNHFSLITGVKSKYLRKLLFYISLNKRVLNKNDKKLIKNLIQCESHRDVSLKVLNGLIENA